MSVRILLPALTLGCFLLGPLAAGSEEAAPTAPEEAAAASDDDVTTRGPGGSPPRSRPKRDAGGGDDGPPDPPPRKPRRPAADTDVPDDGSQPDSSAAAAARARRRTQDGDDAAQPDARPLTLPPAPRLRRTFPNLQAAVDDASPAYRKVYESRLRARIGRDFSVELADEDGTGGSLDVDANRIRIARRALNGSEVVDTLLFESFNADNQARFEASLNRHRRGETTLTQFGEERADIELDTVVRYVKELNRMVQEDPGAEAELPDRARRARDLVNRQLSAATLEGYPGVPDGPDTELGRFRVVNRTSPHDPNASGRLALPTAELYRYERIESLQPSGMISMVFRAVNYRGGTTDAEQAPGKRVREVAAENRQRPKPYLYDRVVTAAEETFPDGERLLQGYRFTPAMRQVAEAEAAQAEGGAPGETSQ